MCNFRQDSACHFSSLVHISLPSGGVQTHYVLVVTVRTAKFTSTQFCVSPYTACMCKARDRYSNRPLFRNTASTDWSSWSVQTVLCEVRTRSLCVIHFSLKLILEGRAGEAWEVSNKWCSFPAPPPNMKMTPTAPLLLFFFFFFSFFGLWNCNFLDVALPDTRTLRQRSMSSAVPKLQTRQWHRLSKACMSLVIRLHVFTS